MNIYEELIRHFEKNGKRAVMSEIAKQSKMKYWKLHYFVSRRGGLYADELFRLMLSLGYVIYAPVRNTPAYGGNPDKVAQDILDNVPAEEPAEKEPKDNVPAEDTPAEKEPDPIKPDK